MRNLKTISLLGIMSFIVLLGCKDTIIPPDDPTLPNNPYDGVDYTDGSGNILIDTNSFLGLHAFIFQTTCAVPACHDGSFEPDFRTIESTYNTLVLHPVIKNYPGGSFEYRVVPNDTTNSWIHERLTTDDQVLGRMPLYDNPLSKAKMKRIEDWIMNGAPDMFGNIPNQPKAEPTVYGFRAYLTDTTGMLLDTTRPREAYPFEAPVNNNINIWLFMYDDIDLPWTLTVNEVEISTDPVNFSNPTVVSINPHTTPNMIMVPGSGNLPSYHDFTFSTTGLSVGEVYYMRVKVKDSNHTNVTIVPELGSQSYLFGYFAFKVI